MMSKCFGVMCDMSASVNSLASPKIHSISEKLFVHTSRLISRCDALTALQTPFASHKTFIFMNFTFPRKIFIHICLWSPHTHIWVQLRICVQFMISIIHFIFIFFASITLNFCFLSFMFLCAVHLMHYFHFPVCSYRGAADSPPHHTQRIGSLLRTKPPAPATDTRYYISIFANAKSKIKCEKDEILWWVFVYE